MKLSKTVLIVSTGLILLTNCTDSHNNYLKLIGGDPVPEDQFQAVVLLNNCTATKIATHFFLLAAHCVTNTNQANTLDSLFSTRGDYDAETSRIPLKVNFDTHNTHVKGNWSHSNQTIVNTFVHPSYRYGWRYFNHETGESRIKHQLAADLAVIEIKEETPDIPIMKLNSKFATTASYKVGYGCESEHIRERSECRPLDKDRQFKYGSVDIPPSPTVLLGKLPDWAPGESLLQTNLHYIISKARFHAAAPTLEDQADHDAGKLPGDNNIVGLGESDSGGPLLLKDRNEYLVTGVNSKKAIWLLDQNQNISIEGAAFDAHARIHKGAPLFAGEWLEDIIKQSPTPTFPVSGDFIYFEPIHLKEFKKLEINKEWRLALSDRRATRKYLQQPTDTLDVYLFSKNGSCPLTPSYLFVEDEENGDDAEITSDLGMVSKVSENHYRFPLDSELDRISSIAFGFKKNGAIDESLNFCYLFISSRIQ